MTAGKSVCAFGVFYIAGMLAGSVRLEDSFIDPVALSLVPLGMALADGHRRGALGTLLVMGHYSVAGLSVLLLAVVGRLNGTLPANGLLAELSDPWVVAFVAAVSIWSAVNLLLTSRAWQQIRAVDRRLRGLCETCGYDLTGNVSGRCPECGTRVPRRYISGLTAPTRSSAVDRI